MPKYVFLSECITFNTKMNYLKAVLSAKWKAIKHARKRKFMIYYTPLIKMSTSVYHSLWSNHDQPSVRKLVKKVVLG